MKKRIKVSAPGKLMLFGEHAVVYGRPCIVTAVDQRIKVLIEVVDGDSIFLDAPDVGVDGLKIEISDIGAKELPKGAKFVLIAVQNFFDLFKIKSGLRIKTESEFSSEFGFGSSSAVTVAVIAALSYLFNEKMTKRAIFDLSYKTVLDVQGIGSGFDLAAAVWGGTLYFLTGGKKIEPLDLGELPLVVGYTGIKADTTTLVRQVSQLKDEQGSLVEDVFNLMAKLVKEARNGFKDRDFELLGRLMNINQGLLDSLGVNTTELSRLIFAVRGAGAYGAKLSGAGGGDCMISLVPKKLRKKVEDAIRKNEGKVINVETGAEGVRIEK